MEHTSLIDELAKDLLQANIKICLSMFDATPKAWSIARKLNASLIRIKPFDINSQWANESHPKYIGKVSKKAQVLGYKVLVSTINSADLTADLWKAKVNYIQGDFIQAPVSDLKLIEIEKSNKKNIK